MAWARWEAATRAEWPEDGGRSPRPRPRRPATPPPTPVMIPSTTAATGLNWKASALSATRAGSYQDMRLRSGLGTLRPAGARCQRREPVPPAYQHPQQGRDEGDEDQDDAGVRRGDVEELEGGSQQDERQGPAHQAAGSGPRGGPRTVSPIAARSRATPSAMRMTSCTSWPSPKARAMSTPLNAPGTEPMQSHFTRPRCTVPRRR
jgi:hypothetical protein